MPSPTQRGAHVIYVAESVREFPDAVRSWLALPENRAVASPGIHDALAMLATGARPRVLLVSMDVVDWNELEFFEHACRLSRETVIHVVGHDHHRDKIDAAVKLGARVFDADELSDEAAADPLRDDLSGPAGLLAGSLRTTPGGPGSSGSPSDRSGLSRDADGDRPSVRLVPAAEVDSPEDGWGADAAASAPVEAAAVEEADDLPDVSFPWSPSPRRPQRTPPQHARPPGASSAPSEEPGRPLKAELTPDELAALLGRHDTPDRKAAGDTTP